MKDYQVIGDYFPQTINEEHLAHCAREAANGEPISITFDRARERMTVEHDGFNLGIWFANATQHAVHKRVGYLFPPPPPPFLPSFRCVPVRSFELPDQSAVCTEDELLRAGWRPEQIADLPVKLITTAPLMPLHVSTTAYDTSSDPRLMSDPVKALAPPAEVPTYTVNHSEECAAMDEVGIAARIHKVAAHCGQTVDIKFDRLNSSVDIMQPARMLRVWARCTDMRLEPEVKEFLTSGRASKIGRFMPGMFYHNAPHKTIAPEKHYAGLVLDGAKLAGREVRSLSFDHGSDHVIVYHDGRDSPLRVPFSLLTADAVRDALHPERRRAPGSPDGQRPFPPRWRDLIREASQIADCPIESIKFHQESRTASIAGPMGSGYHARPIRVPFGVLCGAKTVKLICASFMERRRTPRPAAALAAMTADRDALAGQNKTLNTALQKHADVRDHRDALDRQLVDMRAQRDALDRQLVAMRAQRDAIRDSYSAYREAQGVEHVAMKARRDELGRELRTARAERDAMTDKRDAIRDAYSVYRDDHRAELTDMTAKRDELIATVRSLVTAK
jgi:hypothetical protein